MQFRDMDNSKMLTRFFLISCLLILATNFICDLKWRAEIVQTGGIPYTPLQPYYGYYNLKLDSTTMPQTEGALGFDFSQVYFAAQALDHGQSAYNAKDPEYNPYNRKSAYPPLTNWLYIPLTKLSYWNALLAHNFGTFAIFLALTALVMFKANITKHIWKVYILYALLYFYTPLGFTHFERGQFELFSASAFMLLYFSIFIRVQKPLHLVAAGFFSALKITSLPFIGSVGFIALMASHGKKKWLYLLPIVVVMLTMALFWPQLPEYLQVVRMYETDFKSNGVTFTYFMSPLLTKTFQIACMIILTAIFYHSSVKSNRVSLMEKISFPFALAMAAQGMCIGLYNYEYRIVSILGLIPGMVLWDTRTLIPNHLKTTISVLFAFFLAISFRTFTNIYDIDPVIMTAIYLLFSIAWLIICIYMIIVETKLYKHQEQQAPLTVTPQP